jgi:hypothetical protein
VNTPTAVGTYIFGIVVVIAIGVITRRMLSGWKNRARRQAEQIGALPPMPDLLQPAVIAPTRGLYVGSTFASHWLDRVAVGDLGYRAKAVLTRYPEGILLERSGASPIWIPAASVTAVRTEKALAGKVIPGRGGAGNPAAILVIRWRLPSGTEIDTGFRGDERHDYPRWESSFGDSETPSVATHQAPSVHDTSTGAA